MLQRVCLSGELPELREGGRTSGLGTQTPGSFSGGGGGWEAGCLQLLGGGGPPGRPAGGGGGAGPPSWVPTVPGL